MSFSTLTVLVHWLVSFQVLFIVYPQLINLKTVNHEAGVLKLRDLLVFHGDFLGSQE